MGRQKRLPLTNSPRLGENGDEEVELISEYSWRNFFSTINFVKVLQKITKHRSHRTYMLNQYKASVGLNNCQPFFAELSVTNTGNHEADTEGQSPNASTSGTQARKEPNAMVRTKVASM